MSTTPAIAVRRTGDGDPAAFDVTVHDAGAHTLHRVTLALSDYRRLTAGSCSAEQCIEAAFRFLLDREPKEAILRTFDLSVISRYFPEFEDRLRGYLGACAARLLSADGKEYTSILLNEKGEVFSVRVFDKQP